MRLRSILLGTVLTVGASLPLSAAPNKGFVAADANRDRVVSRSEACAGRTRTLCRNFDVIDANKDGVLTRAEVKAFRNAKRVAKGLPPKR